MSKSPWRSSAVRRPSAVGTQRCRDPGRMALGRRSHRFRAGEGASDRPIEEPGRDRHERLEGQVQLPAEPAAARTRDDLDLLGFEAHDQGDLVAIHVRRLGGRVDRDPIAVANGVARLGLDVGVLDVDRLEGPARDDRGRRESRPRRRRERRDRQRGGCPAIPRAAGRPRGRRQHRGRPAGGSGSQAIGTSSSPMRATVSASPTSATTASPR